MLIVAGSNCNNAQPFIAISTEPQLTTSVGVPSKCLKFQHCTNIKNKKITLKNGKDFQCP